MHDADHASSYRRLGGVDGQPRMKATPKKDLSGRASPALRIIKFAWVFFDSNSFRLWSWGKKTINRTELVFVRRNIASAALQFYATF
jgi:hypothetical protein